MRPVLRCGASSFYQEQRSIMNLGFLRHGWGCAGKQYLPSKLYSALCTERPPRSQDRLGGLSGFEANNRLPDDIVTVVEKRYKAHHQRKDFSQETLQPGPELFNGIELRGVRWKEQNSASCVLGSKKQPLFGMERSIVHYNHGSLLQRRQKLVGKPEFKKSAVHRSAILKRRENSVAHLSGDNAASLVLSTTNLPQYREP